MLCYRYVLFLGWKREGADIQFMRKMNAVGVPKVVGLPKNDEEDAEKVLKEQR
jgi:hypothetical protein